MRLYSNCGLTFNQYKSYTAIQNRNLSTYIQLPHKVPEEAVTYEIRCFEANATVASTKQAGVGSRIDAPHNPTNEKSTNFTSGPRSVATDPWTRSKPLIRPRMR